MIEIVGHAIVSADGMIADRERHMPKALRSDVDWRRFQAELDHAALVVLGRMGHETHPNPGRRRLVVTAGVNGIANEQDDPHVTLWNPAGMSLDDVLDRLGITSGTIAITGGTRVFDLFLPRFTRFDLVEKPAVTIPDGVPCFSAAAPAMALASAGLHASAKEQLEPGVVLTVWS